MTRPKRNRFTAMLRRQGRILGWLTAFAILSFAGNPAIAEGDCDAAKSAKDTAEDRQGRAEVDLTIAQATGDQQAIQDAEEALRMRTAP